MGIRTTNLIFPTSLVKVISPSCPSMILRDINNLRPIPTPTGFVVKNV